MTPRHTSSSPAAPTPAPSPVNNDADMASEQPRNHFQVVPIATEADVADARHDAQHRAVRLESALDALGEFAHQWGVEGDMDANMLIALSTLLALGSEEAGRIGSLLDHADLAEHQLRKGGAR